MLPIPLLLTMAHTKKFGTDSAGYGLAQWTYHTRKKALLAFAQSKKKSVGDLGMQLEFLYKELSESYKGVFCRFEIRQDHSCRIQFRADEI